MSAETDMNPSLGDTKEEGQIVEDDVKSPLDEVKDIKAAAEKTQIATTTSSTVEYIVVQDPNGDEPIELPISEGAVLMSTLQASFPGATGMKYKNPKTGANRAVQVDPTGIKFLPPVDGWDDKTFILITASSQSGERVRGSGGDQLASSAKRRKIDSSDDSEASDDGRDGRSGRKRGAVELREKRDGGGGGGGQQIMQQQQPVDLIVLGVDFKTDDECFKAYFDAIGTVIFCEIKRKVDGGSKGFGFVRMASVDEQNKVLAIPQHMIDNRRCDVKIPDGRLLQDKQGRPSISRIFVGRLTDTVDEESLRKVFGDEAKSYIETAVVTDVFIPKPFRGFAFVTLSSAEAAERIVSRGSLSVGGVTVGLSIAQPREENPSFGPDYGLPAGYRNRREQRNDRRPMHHGPPPPLSHHQYGGHHHHPPPHQQHHHNPPPFANRPPQPPPSMQYRYWQA